MSSATDLISIVDAAADLADLLDEAELEQRPPAERSRENVACRLESGKHQPRSSRTNTIVAF